MGLNFHQHKVGKTVPFFQKTDNTTLTLCFALPSESGLRPIYTGDELECVPYWPDELPFISMAFHFNLLGTQFFPKSRFFSDGYKEVFTDPSGVILHTDKTFLLCTVT